MTTTIVTANIGSTRRRVSELLAVIRKYQPDIVVVTEAYHARWWLRFVSGYRLRQYTRAKGREAPGIAILVAKRRIIINRWAKRMTETWHGPHGRKHQPRVYPVIRLDGGEAIVGYHAPWPYDTRAWWESWRWVSTWARSHTEASVPGDHNAEAHELTPLMVNGLELVKGTKVDHCVVHGMRNVSTTRLTPPKGMHGWLVYRLRGRVT